MSDPRYSAMHLHRMVWIALTVGFLIGLGIGLTIGVFI